MRQLLLERGGNAGENFRGTLCHTSRYELLPLLLFVCAFVLTRGFLSFFLTRLLRFFSVRESGGELVTRIEMFARGTKSTSKLRGLDERRGSSAGVYIEEELLLF